MIVVDAEREPEIEAALDRLVAELAQDDAFGQSPGGNGTTRARWPWSKCR